MLLPVKSLLHRMTQPIESFACLGDTETTQDGPLTYIDNGADILAVAHLDVVLERAPRYLKPYVIGPQLDDRLGVWIILDVLPLLSINVDVLLTDGEESGRSTAAHFLAPKPYNWIVEFDRRGEDAVTYCYNSPPWEDAVFSHFQWGRGSFSDISSMEHVGASAFNVAVGYHREHSPECYADLRTTCRQLKRFQQFYFDFAETPFPHSPESPKFFSFPEDYKW